MKAGELLSREFKGVAMLMPTLADDEDDNNNGDETRLSRRHDVSCPVVAL